MKEQLLRMKKEGNKLTKKVIDLILEAEDMMDFVRSVQKYGCQAGVSGLIYYDDTVKFYNKYREEINELLAAVDEPIEQFFGNEWDRKDPLALGKANQNLLAWFGFEETINVISANLEL